MPTLTFPHDRYATPVRGRLRSTLIMLRRANGHYLRVLSRRTLKSSRQPMRATRIHDVFGNSVAIATFHERAEPLRFTATRDRRSHPRKICLTSGRLSLFLSVHLRRQEFPYLVQFVLCHAAIWRYQWRGWSAWRGNSSMPTAPTPTSYPHLITHGIREACSYRRRLSTAHPASARHSADWVAICRDYAPCS